jgi:hypothetical protein
MWIVKKNKKEFLLIFEAIFPISVCEGFLESAGSLGWALGGSKME